MTKTGHTLIRIDIDQNDLIGWTDTPFIDAGAMTYDTTNTTGIVFYTDDIEVTQFSKKVVRPKDQLMEDEKLTLEKAEKKTQITILEILAKGRQFMAPPSIHPDTKKRLRWINPPNDPEKVLVVHNLFQLKELLDQSITKSKWVLAELFPQTYFPREEGVSDQLLDEWLGQIYAHLGPAISKTSEYTRHICPIHKGGKEKHSSFIINYRKYYAYDYHDETCYSLKGLAEKLGLTLRNPAKNSFDQIVSQIQERKTPKPASTPETLTPETAPSPTKTTPPKEELDHPNFTSIHFEEADRKTLEKLFDRDGIKIFKHQYENKQGTVSWTKDNPALLSTYLQSLYPSKTLRDTDEIYRYNWFTAMYHPRAKTFFREKIKEMWLDDFSQSLVKAVIYDIQASTGIDRSDFVLDKRYIPLKNEILDLTQNPSTKEWIIENQEESPTLYVTVRLPVFYNPTLVPELWVKFLNTGLVPEDIVFLQEWIGYCIYRDLPWHKAVMLVGPTRTGKSTLIYVLTKMLGSQNVTNITIQDLKHTYERARLYLKLLNAHAEISSTELKNSSGIKTLISGDPQSARNPYEKSFEWDPLIKFIFSCNQVPYVYEDDSAWYERWKIIIMNKKQFFQQDKDTDENLKDKLTTDESLSAIFNWALEGLMRLLNQGHFSNCPTWEETRDIWLLHSDPLTQFMDSDWIVWSTDASETINGFYEHFKAYCVFMGITAWTKRRVGNIIKKRYIDTAILTSGWIGNDRALHGLGIRVPGEGGNK